MLKILVVFAVVGFMVLAEAGDITEEQLFALCQPKSGVAEAEVKKARTGDWSSKDPAIRKYSLCYLKRIGVIDNSNNFDKDVFYAKLPKDLTPEKVEADLDDCIKQHHDKTPEEFAWNWAACYFSKHPHALV